MKINKYFFEFISIISLFCIFKIIGLNNASNLGNILGKIVGPFFRSKNITKQNIRTGLGNLDEKNEKEIINNMWSNIGRTFAEYVFLKDFKFNKTNFDHMKIIGTDYLNQIKRFPANSIKSNRLKFLVNVGLNYLTLDRAAETLSGGEAQRIRLATQIIHEKNSLNYFPHTFNVSKFPNMITSSNRDVIRINAFVFPFSHYFFSVFFYIFSTWT